MSLAPSPLPAPLPAAPTATAGPARVPGGPLVTHVDTGEAFTLAGTTVTFLVESRHTGHAWSLLTYDAAPGFVASAPHTHARTTEAFVVLAGTLTVLLDDREVAAGAGACVVVPPGTRHAMRNAGAERVRFLALASPGGHDDFLRELFALIAAAPSWPPADPTALVALAGRYDTTYEVAADDRPSPVPALGTPSVGTDA